MWCPLSTVNMSKSLFCILFPFHPISAWIRRRDPSRVVHYEGGGSRTAATDVVCPMYARPSDIAAIAADKGERRPLILCE